MNRLYNLLKAIVLSKRLVNKIKKLKIYLDDADVVIDNDEFLSTVSKIHPVTDMYYGELYYKIALKNKTVVELRRWSTDSWYISTTLEIYRDLVKEHGKISSSKLGKVLYRDGKY